MTNEPACAGSDNVTFSPLCVGEVFLCLKPRMPMSESCAR